MKFFVVLVILAIAPCILGHGMLMDPVNRASRWRFNSSAPQNWDDNQLYCGGAGIHHGVNEGKCGMCGDSYSLPTPRPHELGGQYGEGVIVKSYQSGTTIPVQAKIATNHKGYFQFNICNLDRFGVETEGCYQDVYVIFPDGSDKHMIPSVTGDYDFQITLPAGVSCQHCVLRWTYVAGNNWGQCPDGSFDTGCGPQETFKTCSDITIH